MNRLYTSFFIILTLVFSGTIIYHTYEGWSFVDSAYFSTTTLATVGYGDLHPTNNITKLFTIFYVLASVTVGLYALSSLGSFQQPKIEKALMKTIKNMPIKRLKLLRKEIHKKRIDVKTIAQTGVGGMIR